MDTNLKTIISKLEELDRFYSSNENETESRLKSLENENDTLRKKLQKIEDEGLKSTEEIRSLKSDKCLMCTGIMPHLVTTIWDGTCVAWPKSF